MDGYPLLNACASIAVYLLAAMFFISAAYYIIFNRRSSIARIFLVLLCAALLIWQIDMSFLARQLGNGLGGYSFWVPVVLQVYANIFIY
jgi:hypothetical protein